MLDTSYLDYVQPAVAPVLDWEEVYYVCGYWIMEWEDIYIRSLTMDGSIVVFMVRKYIDMPCEVMLCRC